METDKSAENKLMGTEQWAIQKELEEDQWQKEYGEKMPYYIDKMNALLANASEEAFLELKSMFLPGQIFEKYKQTDDFAFMFVIMNIYELESDEGIRETILTQGRTVAELIDYLSQLKMILYRLDFGIGEGTEQELLSFLQQHGTSAVTIKIMMNTSVMRLFNTAVKLQKIFEGACLPEYELCMLQYIEEYWKGNYRVQWRLYQYGKRSAVSELEEIPKDEMNTALELLELMWKLYYKQPESEREIAYYLKRHKITNHLWRYLLEIGEKKQVSYYLLLVNALLEEGICDKSEMLLEILIIKHPEYEPAVYLLDKIREKCGRLENS